MPPLSVIIPTHRRTDILRQCLECLAKQTILRASTPPLAAARGSAQHDIPFEVIVVSDGPDPKTDEMITSLRWPFALQYFAIPKSQQGVARNRAVEKARGKYALLIGDDIFLAADACEWHLKVHEKQQAAGNKQQAVLGFTTWDPTLTITPLMRWMEESGVQFGYPRIAEFAQAFLPADRQHFFTYTSNLSLPAKLLWQNPFREDVSLYGWEDVEWGRRLAQAGIPLFYEPAAKGYHHHAFTDAEVWGRSRRLGRSAVEMERLMAVGAYCNTPLHLTPRGWKKMLYCLSALFPTYRGKHCRNFLRGIREAGRNLYPT